MTNTLNFPPCLAITPLREFHIDHGEGRAVAVLYRVLVGDDNRPAGDGDQRRGDNGPTQGVAK